MNDDVKATALCNLTHFLITSGACPWCGLAINPEASTFPTPVWDFEAIRSVLRHGDGRNRNYALMNASRGDGMTIDDRVDLLSIVLLNNEDPSRRFAEEILLLVGSKMSAEDARRLEHQLAMTDDGLAQRIALLAFYAVDHLLPTSMTRRLAIVLWLIENEPHSYASGSPFARILRKVDPIGYEQVKSAWLRQIAAMKPTVATLLNAAAFFAPNDADKSERLCKRASLLEHGG